MKGTMRERTPGHWQIRAYAGRDERGRPVQVARTVKGGKRVAESALTKLVFDVETKGAPLSGTTTVSELIDRWLDYLTPLREPNTIRGYRNHARAVKQAVGSIPVAKLSAQQLDRTYRGWLGDGLKPATVYQRHAIIRAALRQAVRWEILPRAVTELVTPPSLRSAQPQTITDPDVIRTLISAAEEDQPELAAAIWLAAITGAHRGELCALRWSDVEWERGVLRIERAAKTGLDHRGQIVIRDPKSHQSRSIILGDDGLAMLAAYRATVDERAPNSTSQSTRTDTS